MFAQAILEKGALDGLSTGMSSFRYQFTEFIQDERALLAIAIGVVLILVWRVRRR